MGKTIKENKNRCPECDSTMTYLRLKTDEHICRKCGFSWPIKKKKKK